MLEESIFILSIILDLYLKFMNIWVLEILSSFQPNLGTLSEGIPKLNRRQ